MPTKGLEIAPELEKFKAGRLVSVSVLLHVLGLVFMLIYPHLFEKKPVEVPVLTLVPMEKPKVRVLEEKQFKPPDPPKEEPVEKEAPKLKEEAKPTPPKEKVVVKQEPDTVKPQKVVEKVVEEMVPKLEMAESADPRLKFWARRVQKIIQQQWNPPRGLGILGSAQVTVKFTVKRAGDVESIGIATSSGNGGLDQAGTNAIERVGKMPPIPPNFRDKDELAVNIIFAYQGE